MISQQTIDTWNNKIKTIKSAIKTKHITLNDWELRFINNIDSLLHSNIEISFKQSSTLSKIYDRI
jgi:hypothetical protein